MHPKWTVDQRDQDGRRNPYENPTWWSRRLAERYARRNTCAHYTTTVVPYERCH